MHPQIMQQIARQRQAEQRALSARADRVWQARQAQRANEPGPGHDPAAHRRPLRQRAGWALIALGLRLAYSPAGED